MKRKFSNIITASFLAIASLSLTGCEDDNPMYWMGWKDYLISISMEPRELSCSKSELSFDGRASSEAISVKCVNTPWRFTGMADWLRLSPQSGDKDASVSVSVTENPSAQDVRTCVLSLNSESSDFPYSPNVTVTQAKATPYIDVSEESLAFAASGETKTVSVLSNIVYEFYSSQTWLQATVSADRKKLTLKCDPNSTTSSRTAYVYLSGTGVTTKKINVSQVGAGMTISQTTPISVPVDGGKYNMQLQSDVAWTATCGTCSWISVSPSQGNAGTSAVLLEVAPNAVTSSRTGYVYFKIGSTNVVELKVQQEGITLSVSPTSVTFDAVACSRSVSVECNKEWKVLSKPEWVKAPSGSTNGSGTLTLSVDDYNSTSARSGVVSVGIEGLSVKKDINVTQNGGMFDLTDELQFNANAGSTKFTVTTDYSWTARSSQSWLTLSPTSGNGTAQITATATENTSDQPREAIITVRAGDTDKTISVKQKSHYLTITPTEFEAIPSTGGAYELTVASDDAWTASTKAPWLSVSPESGTGNINVKITAADNPSISERKDTVTITPKYAKPIVKAVILQAARYLTVDTREIYFFYRGGESEPVIVNTDGSYKVSTQDSWLTIKETGKTFTVTATENTTEEKREGKVSVSLTGLVAGESKTIDISIVQRVKSQGLDKDGFSSDEDWNVVGQGSTFTLTITGFGEDSDWDKLIK